jgi:hypothetical protein
VVQGPVLVTSLQATTTGFLSLGEAINVEQTMANTGNATSNASYGMIYVEYAGTPYLIQATPFSPLDPETNSSQVWSMTCNYPGNYTFYTGYSYNGYTNTTAGVDYTLAFSVNCLGSTGLQPDLITSMSYSPVPAVIGQPVTITVATTNNGAGYALPFNVSVYPAGIFATQQPPIYSSIIWGGLLPGSSESQTFTISPCTGPLNLTYLSTATIGVGPSDSNLSNDNAMMTFNCTQPLAELVETVGVSNTTPEYGQQVMLNYTTQNIGNGTAGPSSVLFTIQNSTGDTVDSSYTQIGSIAPNDSITQNTTFNCLSAQAYTITATADAFGQVNQTTTAGDSDSAQLTCNDQYTTN